MWIGKKFDNNSLLIKMSASFTWIAVFSDFSLNVATARLMPLSVSNGSEKMPKKLRR